MSSPVRFHLGLVQIPYCGVLYFFRTFSSLLCWVYARFLFRGISEFIHWFFLVVQWLLQSSSLGFLQFPPQGLLQFLPVKPQQRGSLVILQVYPLVLIFFLLTVWHFFGFGAASPEFLSLTVFLGHNVSGIITDQINGMISKLEFFLLCLK